MGFALENTEKIPLTRQKYCETVSSMSRGGSHTARCCARADRQIPAGNSPLFRFQQHNRGNALRQAALQLTTDHGQRTKVQSFSLKSYITFTGLHGSKNPFSVPK